MNFTPLEEAYKIHHTNPNTYQGTIQYSTICIYCSYPHSKSLMNDGGSFRQCDRCRKQFRANVMSKPIQNFVQSTNHLRGTN